MRKVLLTRKINSGLYIFITLLLMLALYIIFTYPSIESEVKFKAQFVVFSAFCSIFYLGFHLFRFFNAPKNILLELVDNQIYFDKEQAIFVDNKIVLIGVSFGRLSLSIYQDYILEKKVGSFYVCNADMNNLKQIILPYNNFFINSK